jgi:hypothetical protein
MFSRKSEHAAGLGLFGHNRSALPDALGIVRISRSESVSRTKPWAEWKPDATLTDALGSMRDMKLVAIRIMQVSAKKSVTHSVGAVPAVNAVYGQAFQIEDLCFRR